MDRRSAKQNMKIFIRHVAMLLLFPVALVAVDAVAADSREKNEPKVVTGMSIVGNDETPKSLYIVPWKDLRVGKDVSFTSSVLNEGLSPVDKRNFIRELDLYTKDYSK